MPSAGVSLVLSIAYFPFCKSGRRGAFCYCSYFCRRLGAKNQSNYGTGSHSTPAGADRCVYTVISLRFLVRAPKPASGCRWAALEAARSEPIGSETRELLQALPLRKLPSNFRGPGSSFTPCAGSRGCNWVDGISPALCIPQGLLLSDLIFPPNALHPLLLIHEVWECLNSVYCFYCLGGKMATELWLFYGRRKALWNPRHFFFFNPNKECRKVTSNLILSEESLAGYSLGTCFESKNQPENKFNYFLICLVRARTSPYCRWILEVLVRENVAFSFDVGYELLGVSAFSDNAVVEHCAGKTDPPACLRVPWKWTRDSGLFGPASLGTLCFGRGENNAPCF